MRHVALPALESHACSCCRPASTSHSVGSASSIGSRAGLNTLKASWASEKSSDAICFCDHVKGLGGCVQGAKRPAHTPRLPIFGRPAGENDDCLNIREQALLE